MTLFDAGLIRDRYEQNGHFYYPEMERLIDEVVENPAKEIAIPDDFVSKSLEDSNFLLNIVQRIKIFFKKLFKNFLFFFSSSERAKYKFAVKKIQDAYCSKIADIARLANTLMCSKEIYEKAAKKITSLKSKIHALGEVVQAMQDTLQEHIDTKNLIIQQAETLIRKRREPIELPVKKSFFKRIASVVKQPKFEPEVAAIKDLDPFFDLDNLTESTIAAYSDEVNLRQERIELTAKQGVLLTKQQKLEAAGLIAAESLENIKKTTQEIKTLELENFFSETALTVRLEISTVNKIEKKPIEIKLETLRKDIRDKTSSIDLAILYSTLINRLPENAISNWICDEQGNFTLKLNKFYSIWMPEEEYTGGIVLMLGYEKNGEIKGKLENNTIHFTSGMNNYVKVPVWGYTDSTISKIVYDTRTNIRIWGGKLNFSDYRQKTYTSLKNAWKDKGLLIPDDYPGSYQKFLRDKA